RALAFTSSGRAFASASFDGTARWWDIEARKEIHKILSGQGALHSLCLSPDGEWLATGGGDHNIRIWSVSTGKLQVQCIGHKSTVTGLAFFSDGKRLVSSSVDGSIRIWSATTGELIRQIEPTEDRESVNSLLLSEIDDSVIAGCDDGQIRIRRIRDGVC